MNKISTAKSDIIIDKYKIQHQTATDLIKSLINQKIPRLDEFRQRIDEIIIDRDAIINKGSSMFDIEYLFCRA